MLGKMEERSRALSATSKDYIHIGSCIDTITSSGEDVVAYDANRLLRFARAGRLTSVRVMWRGEGEARDGNLKDRKLTANLLDTE